VLKTGLDLRTLEKSLAALAKDGHLEVTFDRAAGHVDLTLATPISVFEVDYSTAA
jgi:hypothetical protein